MSAITELKEAWETKDHNSDALYGDFCRAYPDIKRLLELVEQKDMHEKYCGAADYERPFPCDCARIEILAILSKQPNPDKVKETERG